MKKSTVLLLVAFLGGVVLSTQVRRLPVLSQLPTL